MDTQEIQQAEKGLKIGRSVATTIQLFEWLSMVVLGWVFFDSKATALIETAPHLSVLIRLVEAGVLALIVIFGSSFADLVKFSQYSGMESMTKKGLKEAETIFYFSLFAILAIIFILAEREMTFSLAKKNFGIEKDTTPYTADKNYLLNQQAKDKLIADFKQRKSELIDLKNNCAACNSVSASYVSKIAVWRRKKAYDQQDVKIIANAIANLESKREEEITAERQKHEAKIDAQLNELSDAYNQDLTLITTSLKSITNRVDTARSKNDKEIELREKQIRAYTWGFSIFTILIQLFCRIWVYGYLLKLNRIEGLYDENNPLLDALQNLPVVGKFFEDNYWVIFRENNKGIKQANAVKYEMLNSHNTDIKFEKTSKYLNWLRTERKENNIINWFIYQWNNADYEKDEAIHNNMMIAYEQGYTPKRKHFITGETQIVENKISEKVVENVENVEENEVNLTEKEYYESVISTFTMFLGDAESTDENREYYENVISTFTIFLNDLN